MPVTQQQPTFEPQEAERFAALVAGCDTGNGSEAEAIGKFRLLRRMADEKKLRIVDALELAEIRQAIDVQMRPQRHGGGDSAFLQAEIERVKAALAEREHQTALIIDDYERKLAARQTQSHRTVREFLAYAWGFAGWRMACLLAILGGWLALERHLHLTGWKLYASGVAGLWLLLLWCAAEIDETGWGQLLMKLALFGGGCAGVLAQHDYRVLILCAVALLTATRFVANACERLKDIPAIAAVVAWFI
jgi:hypothetical protein